MKILLTCLLAGLVFALSPGIAQVKNKPGQRTIGVLFWHASPNDRAALGGFREGLKATGQSFHIVERHADSDRKKAAAHLRAFEARAVDLVVALGTEATRIAAATLKRTPLVFTAVTDPVSSDIVPSWKGSGSFLAGNSNHIDAGRVLTDFKRSLPGLTTLGVLNTRGNPVSAAEIRGMEQTLRSRASLGIRLEIRTVKPKEDIAAAAGDLLKTVDALWIPIDFGVYSRMEVVAAVARERRKPLVTTTQKAIPHAVVGVLPDYHTLGMQAVEIMDRILNRGVEPGAIPVGTMQGRILVLNLKAARRIAYSIPVEALASADRILTENKRP